MRIDEWVPALLALVWSWAWQLLLGAALTIAATWIVERRRRARRTTVGLLLACRVLRRTAPWAALAAAGIWAAARLTIGGSRPAVEPFSLLRPGLLFVLCGFATSGCWLMLAAAQAESRGRRDRARRLVRVGGLTSSAALSALLVLMGPRLVVAVSLPLATGWIALALSAGAGLLAGLSGKPRPSATFSVGFYAVGSLALVLAPLVAGN